VNLTSLEEKRGRFMSSFGEQLTHYRKALGMSQRFLAERCGLGVSHLNRVEKGVRKPPQLKSLLCLLEELHLADEQAVELLQLAGYSPSLLKQVDDTQQGRHPAEEKQVSGAGSNQEEEGRTRFDISRFPPRTPAMLQERLWARGYPAAVLYLSPESRITAANLLSFWLWGSPIDEELRREDLLGCSIFELVTRPWNLERIALPEKEDDFWWNTITSFKGVEQALPKDVSAAFKTIILAYPILRLLYLYGDHRQTLPSYKSFLKMLPPQVDLTLLQPQYLEFWGTTELIQSHLITEGILVSYQPANSYTREILEKEYQRLIKLYGDDSFLQQL
jgi:transcriptional regulator with XRE-family HTH domain